MPQKRSHEWTEEEKAERVARIKSGIRSHKKKGNKPRYHKVGTGYQVLDSVLIEYLLRGKNYVQIGKLVSLSHGSTKKRFLKIFRDYEIHSGDKLVKLVTLLSYARNPELVPFNDGDRADNIGDLDADSFAHTKLAIEREHKKYIARRHRNLLAP